MYKPSPSHQLILDTLTEKNRKGFAIGGGIIQGENLNTREGFNNPEIKVSDEIKKYAKSKQNFPAAPYIRKVGPTWKVVIDLKSSPLYYYGSFPNETAARAAGKKEHAKRLKLFNAGREGYLSSAELIDYLQKKHKIKASSSSIASTAQAAGFDIIESKGPGSFTLFKTPSEDQVNQFKANRVKAPGMTEEGKKAFQKREKRAIKLLESGKYTISEANEILKTEFPEIKKGGMKSKLTEYAKTIEGIPSGVTGETAASVKKVKKDLEKLNKSNVKKLLNKGITNLNVLGNATADLLDIDKDLALRRIGQLIEAYTGDTRYLKVKKDNQFIKNLGPLLEGLNKTGSKDWGGLGGGLQRAYAEYVVTKDLGKNRSFFHSLRNRIGEMIPGSDYDTDEIKNIRSSARYRSSPYSIFLQGIKSDINQKKGKKLDKLTGIYEGKIQKAKTIEEKKKFAEEYNKIARGFADKYNKNLKPGELPVRVLEFQIGVPPSTSIKNKTALKNYGDLFENIYKKHNYSMSVPEDIKSADEIKSYLKSPAGSAAVKQAVTKGSNRVFSDLFGLGNFGESLMEDIKQGKYGKASWKGAGALAVPLIGYIAQDEYRRGEPVLDIATSAFTGIKPTEAIARSFVPEEKGGYSDKEKLARLQLKLLQNPPKASLDMSSVLSLAQKDPEFTGNPNEYLSYLESKRDDKGPNRRGIESIATDAEKRFQKQVMEPLLRRKALKRNQNIEGLISLFNRFGSVDPNMQLYFQSGGRVGFANGPNDPSKRKFMKLMAGIASIPFLGKFIKPATKAAPAIVDAVKTIPLPGKPEWFDSLVNKVISKGVDVSKNFSTKDRQVVHQLKIDDAEDVTVYRNLDDGEIRVSYDSPDNMGEQPVDLVFKPGSGQMDETTGKIADEFYAVEAEPRGIRMGPDDYDIEFDGENLVDDISDLTSDTSKLKQVATDKKPTLKEFVESKKKKDQTNALNKNQVEQAEYLENKYGPGDDLYYQDFSDYD
tara:strand:+ start:2246 stop:5227 length:2982 start_codon:yes stop_codon:yes gene_type:complete